MSLHSTHLLHLVNFMTLPQTHWLCMFVPHPHYLSIHSRYHHDYYFLWGHAEKSLFWDRPDQLFKFASPQNSWFCYLDKDIIFSHHTYQLLIYYLIFFSSWLLFTVYLPLSNLNHWNHMDGHFVCFSLMPSSFLEQFFKWIINIEMIMWTNQVYISIVSASE